MKIERLKEHQQPMPDTPVTVKKMGHVTEIRDMSSSRENVIRKIDRDNYVDTRTGEVKEFEHVDKRIENPESVARSLRNLRDIINTNVTNAKKCLWVTLTYSENMTDAARLYDDYRKFNMRLQEYLQRKSLPKCEYIAAAEPQERGAWHLHVLYLFPRKAPYIGNKDLARLWGHGFVKVTSLKDVDNIGLYLTAYLGDMDLTEAVGLVNLKNATVKEVTSPKEKKAIVKGARLRRYPSGFRIYRCSRGVKKPEVYESTEAEAAREVGGAALTFESTVRISNEDGKTVNIIHHRHYNKNVKPNRGEHHEINKTYS